MPEQPGDERNDSINNVGSQARVDFGGANQPKGLESIALAPWASRRRQDLLDLLDQLTWASRSQGVRAFEETNLDRSE